MSGARSYHPPNWEPLVRWLPVPFCQREFDWMWREEQLECYRYRESGKFLLLDEFGQCFELTEVGAMPADFRQHYQHCTGVPYKERMVVRDCDLEDEYAGENEESDGDREVYGPPNGNALLILARAWSDESGTEPHKRDQLLNEIRTFNILFLGEVEQQCQNLMDLAKSWLGE